MPCCGRGNKNATSARRRQIKRNPRVVRSASQRQAEAGGAIERVEPEPVEPPKAIEPDPVEPDAKDE